MADPTYDALIFKIPKESDDDAECSEFMVESVEDIMERAIQNKKNRIVLNTKWRV